MRGSSPPGAGERRHAGANKVRETRPPIWHGLGGIGSELVHESHRYPISFRHVAGLKGMTGRNFRGATKLDREVKAGGPKRTRTADLGIMSWLLKP